MLGGKDPLLIFYTRKKLPTLPFVGDKLKFLPLAIIPFYLSEEAGLIVNDHSRSISNDIETVPAEGLGDAETYEKNVGEQVTINLTAKKDNVLLTALLSLFAMVQKRVDTSEYGLTLFYDDVLMVDASLVSLNTFPTDNTDKREINFTLQQRPQPKSKLGEASSSLGLSFVSGTAGGPA